MTLTREEIKAALRSTVTHKHGWGCKIKKSKKFKL